MLVERTFTVTHTGCGEETDELRVRVTTTERSGNMFPQCLTEIDYEAGFQFPETLPGRVVVEHRSLNSLRPVARVAP